MAFPMPTENGLPRWPNNCFGRWWATWANNLPDLWRDGAVGQHFVSKLPIHVVDTTVMELVANCMDWAKHRRRKAAAKTHMRLNLQSLLPNFVIIDTAGEHDNQRARELCAGVRSGEIVLFDKGYVDFGHLRDLDERGVFWVTRAKDNMAYDVVQPMPESTDDKILRDEVIVLSNPDKPAPELMRRICGAGWKSTAWSARWCF